MIIKQLLSKDLELIYDDETHLIYLNSLKFNTITESYITEIESFTIEPFKRNMRKFLRSCKISQS